MVRLNQRKPGETSHINSIPASRSTGSMTMRVSSSTVPRSATAASRSEATRSPEDAIFSSPRMSVPSAWYCSLCRDGDPPRR